MLILFWCGTYLKRINKVGKKKPKTSKVKKVSDPEGFFVNIWICFLQKIKKKNPNIKRKKLKGDRQAGCWRDLELAVENVAGSVAEG